MDLPEVAQTPEHVEALPVESAYNPETMTSKAAGQSSASTVSIDDATQAAATSDDSVDTSIQSSVQQQPTDSSHPMIADDVDLIEKEWVDKAKEIVNKTRDNPYLQNKAVNEMKADYIKKRYNKAIKIDEN